jgi:hypothetical protein
MNASFKHQLDHWSLGAVRSSIQGGATALSAFAGTAIASAAGLPVMAMDLKQALAVFGGAAFWGFVDYLKKNPLPEIPDDKTDNPMAPAADASNQETK